MKLLVKYFGMIADITGLEEECLEMEPSASIQNCRDLLNEKYKGIESLGYRMSVNLDIYNDLSITLKENDEIALLPPFAGG